MSAPGRYRPRPKEVWAARWLPHDREIALQLQSWLLGQFSFTCYTDGGDLVIPVPGEHGEFVVPPGFWLVLTPILDGKMHLTVAEPSAFERAFEPVDPETCV